MLFDSQRIFQPIVYDQYRSVPSNFSTSKTRFFPFSISYLQPQVTPSLVNYPINIMLPNPFVKQGNFWQQREEKKLGRSEKEPCVTVLIIVIKSSSCRILKFVKFFSRDNSKFNDEQYTVYEWMINCYYSSGHWRNCTQWPGKMPRYSSL